MPTKTGYLIALLGLIALGVGSYQTIQTLATTWLVMIWGTVTAVGLLMVGIGFTRSGSGTETVGDPNKGLGKTDSRIGPR